MMSEAYLDFLIWLADKPLLQICQFRPRYYILYIVMYNINRTTFDRGVNSAWLGGVEFFWGITPLLRGVNINPCMMFDRTVFAEATMYMAKTVIHV